MGQVPGPTAPPPMGWVWFPADLRLTNTQASSRLLCLRISLVSATYHCYQNLSKLSSTTSSNQLSAMIFKNTCKNQCFSSIGQWQFEKLMHLRLLLTA